MGPLPTNYEEGTMKLYLYDQKHEKILSEMEIKHIKQVEKIITFLKVNGITDSYKTLIVASSYIKRSDVNGAIQIFFEYNK